MLFRFYRLQKKRGIDSDDEDGKRQLTAVRGKVKARVGGACFQLICDIKSVTDLCQVVSQVPSKPTVSSARPVSVKKETPPAKKKTPSAQPETDGKTWVGPCLSRTCLLPLFLIQVLR